ncbi:ECF subfamily RNA polymerase sigma-24 subunit [Pseudomonas flexibilis]|uniref:RNA polymerase sigma factor n=1 Tax=Pseudomonas flexibilis TaxID=706570 RepID=A0A1N6PNL9_9PSED|nr:sigma-70 family RNA polymerase sigma factor [Pseudomonas flexibilis]KHL69965.1 ECF subfamily RNA polymerase sigma-24 subunit [Pseudomonas flexibilis]SIQ05863.1 RNA polymerase, sigma subunit, ECF family [Pseudomonas flexibilis]
MKHTDEELIKQAQAGNPHAFGLLVRRHQAWVLRFVRRLPGTPADAPDIAQETFLKAWQAIARWRPEARFRTWLLQIARNTTRDEWRRQLRQPSEPFEVEQHVDPSPSPVRRLELDRRLRQLERLLERLPAEQRVILLLREQEGLSYAELSNLLGIPPGTVKSRLARAREGLLEHYRLEGGEHLHD